MLLEASCLHFPYYFGVELKKSVHHDVNDVYYLERASAINFKDANAPRSGHNDVAFYLFFVTNINAWCPFDRYDH